MVVCTARSIELCSDNQVAQCSLIIHTDTDCTCNWKPRNADHMINSAGHVRQCLASEIAVAVVFAIAYSRDSWICFAILWYRPILQAARQTTAGSIDFREVQIASNGSKVSKSRHNSRTKLRMKFLHIQSEIMSSCTYVASFNSHLSACAAKLM